MRCIRASLPPTSASATISFRTSLWWLGKLAAVSPEKGARTSIHLASAPEIAEITGEYFIDSRPVRSSAASYDQEADGTPVAHQRQSDGLRA